VRILIVEDEPLLADQLVAAARAAGYAVDHATDGRQADILVQNETFDAVVLDLGLPGIDGLTLLTRWRTDGLTTPILILTARGSWHEKVQGIDNGADDYMSKPFETAEVLARIRALIRRATGHTRSELRCGDVVVDTRNARVMRAGAPVKLTSHEFRVLAYLMHHHTRIVTKTELSEHIYAQDLDRDSNTVEVFVARLRRKLGGSVIDTVRGIGYRMSTAGEQA
jgi:two-component system OmpR family response regulator